MERPSSRLRDGITPRPGNVPRVRWMLGFLRGEQDRGSNRRPRGQPADAQRRFGCRLRALGGRHMAWPRPLRPRRRRRSGAEARSVTAHGENRLAGRPGLSRLSSHRLDAKLLETRWWDWVARRSCNSRPPVSDAREAGHAAARYSCATVSRALLHHGKLSRARAGCGRGERIRNVTLSACPLLGNWWR